jgi:serine phosphatase RsbU (regulator of sigma subunit)
MTVSAERTLLWISNGPLLPQLRQATADRWHRIAARPGEPFEEYLTQADIAVVYLACGEDDPMRLSKLLERIEPTGKTCLFIVPEDSRTTRHVLSSRHGPFLCVDENIDACTLAGQLDAAGKLQSVLGRMREEIRMLKSARSLEDGGDEELAKEMHLAARLQRDFMPRELPELGDARFGVLFRPASWVSGDIYDIFRLDETHVGFYVVDAVGHGMPAALLTMFIRRALQTKRITGNSYHIIPPDQAMAQLNADICQEDLSGSQFCTAVYCVLDTERGELTYARAGHPEPLLVRANGNTELLKASGDLLGVFPEGQYEAHTITLDPGDRVVLYTDGAEDALREPFADPSAQPFADMMQPYIRLHRDDLLLQFSAAMDIRFGQPRGDDDITLLVLDMESHH